MKFSELMCEPLFIRPEGATGYFFTGSGDTTSTNTVPLRGGTEVRLGGELDFKEIGSQIEVHVKIKAIKGDSDQCWVALRVLQTTR